MHDIFYQHGRLSEDEMLKELERLSEEHRIALTELRELTEQLKTVNSKLNEAESLKTHFISNITNEIINPFASILGLARNIQLMKQKDWDKMVSMVKMIYSEAFCLDFQLKNIFAAAELEAGEIVPQISNVGIIPVIEGVIESLEHDAIRKDIKFEIIDQTDTPEDRIFVFKTDAEKLQLILSNLISNAIKYSIASSEVHIIVAKPNGKLKISVQDYGIGISKADQKYIFDRFKRLDSNINSLNRGHGLGLSITLSLIDLLAGNIEIVSQKNKGATFIVTIPEPNIEIDDFAPDGNEIFFGEDEIF